MSAKHEVNTSGISDNFLITHTFLFPTEVRDADDEVAVLLFQDVRHLLSRLHRVKILCGPIVLVINQAVEFRREPKDANLQAISLEDNVRLDNLVEVHTHGSGSWHRQWES
jgi:hypothetical protein